MCFAGRWIVSCLFLASLTIFSGDDPQQTADKHVESDAINVTNAPNVTKDESLQCDEDRAGCEHVCQIDHGRIQCTCYRGFRLAEDAKSCIGKYH